MDDPRRDAVEPIDLASSGELEAVQHFLDMADQIQAQLEGMSAMLVEFRLPAVEQEEQTVEPPEPGRTEGSTNVTVSLDLALSTVEQIFHSLEQGGDFYQAGSTLTRVYGDAITTISQGTTGQILAGEKNAMAISEYYRADRTRSDSARQDSHYSNDMSSDSLAYESHDQSSVFENLRKASEAIRTMETVSESVVSLSDSSEAGMQAQTVAGLAAGAQGQAQDTISSNVLSRADSVHELRETVRAGRSLDLPSFAPRKKAVEEAKTKIEETAARVSESIEAHHEAVARSQETLQTALTASRSQETVTDHLQLISRMVETAAEAGLVSEQMIEAIERATGTESIIREGIISADSTLENFSAQITSHKDTTGHDARVTSQINSIAQTVNLGEAMSRHVMESLYGSSVIDSRASYGQSLLNYGSSLPAGHDITDITTYEANHTPIEVFNQVAGSAVMHMAAAAPQLAPVRNVPRGLLPAIGSVQAAPADKEKDVSSTANFTNTFNITVNVKGGSEEAEMKELGRKIGQILSEELKRYGGM